MQPSFLSCLHLQFKVMLGDAFSPEGVFQYRDLRVYILACGTNTWNLMAVRYCCCGSDKRTWIRGLLARRRVGPCPPPQSMVGGTAWDSRADQDPSTASGSSRAHFCRLNNEESLKRKRKLVYKVDDVRDTNFKRNVTQM